ncbi:hypothetical protein [Gelidibacter salicanalis]|uniref:Nicotinate-nucleotide adenylyltransferase n=1 Tax=Gelidibacter salicanalis TaxID=291193 RepID=A0A934KTL9_9FLAO|nr:hypothetical protein [Gelidibacter salicanalis]MBJ7879953.1 hypothetical protein [Gelidibacter salicanalis]
MKKMLIGVVILGLTNLVQSQSTETSISRVKLKEVLISPIKNTSYYDAVYDPYAAKEVRDLETVVAKYDISVSEISGKKFNSYTVMFSNNIGKIITIYDKDGVLLKSVEKFKNVRLPEKVRVSLSSKYPGWRLDQTVFRVKYANNKGVDRAYHLQIKKGKEKLNLKVTCEGHILKSSDYAAL